ncbi:hypothetical protein [Reinekea sp.]|jgi:hypothetical protein|uniref:hypothetical protein n=1 Tax=Reinekea sp. TaxID=1970455 RepID=UPI00398919CF
MKRILCVSIIFTSLWLASNAQAAQFYRWKDEQGNLFVQSYIPPEYVANGYEIVDEAGNLVKKVSPQISEAEKQAKEMSRINGEMQRARDEELLKFYRSPSDVDRAMTTWLSRMDMEIRVKQNRIRIKENEFASLQEKAANQERSGQQVDAEIEEQMKAIQLEIDQFNLEIREVQLRQDESRSEFKLDRERMVELWKIINGKDWVEKEDPVEK